MDSLYVDEQEYLTVKLIKPDVETVRKTTKGKNDAERFHNYIGQCENTSAGNSDAGLPPKFLFNISAKNEEIYEYLRMNPDASAFLYKKYRDNKPFIEELTDPDNPIYIPEVDEKLKLPKMRENLEERLRDLNREIERKTTERNNLIETLNQMDEEYSTLEKKIQTSKAEINTLETQILNIHSMDGLRKISSFIRDVRDFIQKTYENPANRDLTELSGTEVKFLIDKFKFSELKSTAENVELYLKTDQFSEEDIETKKKENARLIAELDKERERGLAEMNVLKYLRPKTKMQKLADGLTDHLDYLNNPANCHLVQTKKEAYYTVPMIGFNAIREDLVDTVKTIQDLQNQFEKVEVENDN